MGSLACIGCSKMISLKDGQLTEFKIHMMDTHNFFKEINSVINVAFLNVAEEETLDQLLGPRIKHFLRTGAHQPWEENVFERRSSQELEDSDLPDIDETVSDDEEDELGKEGDLDKIQDKTLEFKLLEKLMKSVEGTVQPMGTEEEGEPAKTDGKYVENLRAKIREDEEEESDAETSIKGGEEDNDSDTDPFSPPVTPQKRLPTFNPIDSNQQDDQNHFGTTLEMSAPTSLAADVKFEKIPSSLTAPQVKIERALVLDVLGNSLEGNTREILDSHNEKRRLVENPDKGIMFDGEFERIMFDDKRRVSSKREEEDPPQLTEFCRLCYCRFDFYPCERFSHFRNHHCSLTAWLEPQWTNTWRRSIWRTKKHFLSSPQRRTWLTSAQHLHSVIALGFLHVSIAPCATQVSDREPPQQAPQHDAQVCRGVEGQVQNMRKDCFRAQDEDAHADTWGKVV